MHARVASLHRSDLACLPSQLCDDTPPLPSQIDAMEELILLMASGEQYRNMLMPVIRFVCTHNNHRLKKLCQLFWEVRSGYWSMQTR